MAEVLKHPLFLLIILSCGHDGRGWALRFDISPSTMDALKPSAVHMSCVPDPSIDQEAQELMVMKITRHHAGDPISVLTKQCESSNVDGSGNLEEFRVNGHIDKVPSKSYLRLTLLNAKEEDAGMYKCVIYYLDGIGHMKEMTAAANLTIKNQDIKILMKYLVDTVSELSDDLKTRTERETFLTNKITLLENKLQMQVLERRERETELRKNVSDLEEKFQTQASKVNRISAFSAKYTFKGSEDVGDTIVFNDIIMKIGGDYNEKSGLFTASRSGVYGFHLTTMMITPNGYTDLGLFVNGNLVAALSMASSGDLDQSSVSVFVKMKTNDVMKVSVRGKTRGMELRRDYYSVFTGYLFHEIDEE